MLSVSGISVFLFRVVLFVTQFLQIHFLIPFCLSSFWNPIMGNLACFILSVEMLHVVFNFSLSVFYSQFPLFYLPYQLIVLFHLVGCLLFLYRLLSDNCF